MTPFVSIKAPRSDNITVAVAAAKPAPDLSYLPAFNVAGGRPNERRGTRGSFTPGVRIMAGGPQAYPGRSAPAPKATRGGGGAPRDAAHEADDSPDHRHGKVLFVSSVHKPDLSGETRYSAVLPTRFNVAGGRFAPGAARHWAGGQPRDVPRAPVRDPGTVLFRSARLAHPDLAAIVAEETNVAGGRGDERHGRMGSFEHGVVEVAGGPLHMPSGAARDLELWHEGGQKENKYRRCGPSHFVAGVSILSGGMPVY